MSNPLFTFRFDRAPFGNEIIAIFAELLDQPVENFESLFSRGQFYTDFDGSYIGIDLQLENQSLVIRPNGEPGWSFMLNFASRYAASVYAPLIVFDEGYSFCVRVDAGSTLESLNQLIEFNSFCGEELVKKMSERGASE